MQAEGTFHSKHRRVFMVGASGTIRTMYFRDSVKHVLDRGIHEFFALSLGLAEFSFEFVAERYELIDFGDDALLFRKRWDGYWTRP